MPVDSLVASFKLLPASKQLNVLARYAYQLTLIARVAYVADSDDVADPVRLRDLNECQHRVTAHIVKLLYADHKRYPDDVIVGIAIDGDAWLEQAFSAILDQVRAE